MSDTLQIGDRLVVEVSKENRDWGYDPCPDGTFVTVDGFSEICYGRTHNNGIPPGVYQNTSWVKVRTDEGKQFCISSCFVSHTDKDLYEQRRQELIAKYETPSYDWRQDYKRLFLRDLPFTDFWEGDFVRAVGPAFTRHHGKMLQVTRIDYSRISTLHDDGTAYPIYSISLGFRAGWYTCASLSDLELVSRGQVWNYFAGNKLHFNNLQEEATFFRDLGHTREVKNPRTNLFVWTKDEVLDAIRTGIVHGFTMSNSFFTPLGEVGRSPRINALRFDDEDLGRRVAAETLKGFNVSA